MTEADKPQFIAAIAGIATFYGTELPKMSLEIYWDALKHMDLGSVKEAIRSHIQDTEHGRWMPKPAHLIAQARATLIDQRREDRERLGAAARRGLIGNASPQLIGPKRMNRIVRMLRAGVPETAHRRLTGGRHHE